MLVFVILLTSLVVNWLGAQLLANGPIILARMLGNGGWLLLGLGILSFLAWCIGSDNARGNRSGREF
ncbi:MAG: hypothetical protein ACPGVO_20315 [Spirulinaceae cyanobacterium]